MINIFKTFILLTPDFWSVVYIRGLKYNVVLKDLKMRTIEAIKTNNMQVLLQVSVSLTQYT